MMTNRQLFKWSHTVLASLLVILFMVLAYKGFGPIFGTLCMIGAIIFGWVMLSPLISSRKNDKANQKTQQQSSDKQEASGIMIALTIIMTIVSILITLYVIYIALTTNITQWYQLFVG